MLKNLGIKSILILMLVLSTLVGVGVVGFLGYYTGARALDEAIFQQLTSVRASKAQQIESYFAGLRNQVEILAEDPAIASALEEIQEGYKAIPDRPVPDAWLQTLNTYYGDVLIPSLAEDGGTPTPGNYVPETTVGRYLQYRYLAANPHPVGEKRKMVSTGDGSAYDAAHARHHPYLVRLVEEFGYYDLFLVDLEGNVVYTAHKETDFATNLKKGPYRNSNLAKVYDATSVANHPGFVKIVDFDHYAPSYGQPAVFIASPIFEGSQPAGALIFQISVDEINRITTGDGRWAEQGLGKSGETYLVGQDNRMRSISRFLKEDKEGFLEALRNTDLNTQIIERIDRVGSTILELPIPDDYFKGRSASRREGEDYRGIRVLSSWQPLNIGDVHWRILSEMDLAEARAPIREFGRRVLVAGSVIAIVITLLAMAVAALFVRPIRALIDGARRIANGETGVLIDAGSQPEYADLAHSFNKMVDSLRGETQLAEQQSEQREQLLLRLLPQSVVERMIEGESRIAEGYENVTVLLAEIVGLAELSMTRSAEEFVELTNELIGGFEEATETHGVEKFKTQGSTLIAISGFSAPRLDHARCAVDFGLEAFAIVNRFNQNRRTSLDLRIGVDSGPVVAGVIGQHRIVYDLVGDTVIVADRLRSRAEPGMILVSPEVRERAGEIYRFEAITEIEIEGEKRLAASPLRPAARRGAPSPESRT